MPSDMSLQSEDIGDKFFSGFSDICSDTSNVDEPSVSGYIGAVNRKHDEPSASVSRGLRSKTTLCP